MKAYWFNNDGGNRHNSRPIHFEVGTTYKVLNPKHVVPCHYGYHASVHPFDALRYVNGTHVDLVELDGKIIKNGNKHVASERTHIARRDARPMLKEFCLWAAREAVAMWPDAPSHVRQWAKTGKGQDYVIQTVNRWFDLNSIASAVVCLAVHGDVIETQDRLIQAYVEDYRRKMPWWRRILSRPSRHEAQQRVRKEFKTRVEAMFATPGAETPQGRVYNERLW